MDNQGCFTKICLIDSTSLLRITGSEEHSTLPAIGWAPFSWEILYTKEEVTEPFLHLLFLSNVFSEKQSL